MSKLMGRGAAIAVLAAVAMPACDDPVPGPIVGLVLVVRTFPSSQVELADVDWIEIRARWVVLVYSDSMGGESKVTVDTAEREIQVRNVQRDLLVAQYQA